MNTDHSLSDDDYEFGEGDIDAIWIAPTVNKESELKHSKHQGQEVKHNEVHHNFHHW